MTWFHLVARTLEVLGLQAQDLQLADANALAARHYPNLSTDRPALIGPLTDASLCQKLGFVLRRAYPEDHEAIVVSEVDGEQPVVQSLVLRDLAYAPLHGSTLLYLAPLPCPSALETFQATVAHLRAPDGCPWDRKQTHQSLRQGFLEESYEVLDALDRGDLELLQEELGDVLLHILLQVQIASEQGEFLWSDVVCRVNRKIVYRHPHVFSGLAVDGIEQVLSNWEELKRREKQERAEAPSPVEGIPPSMPALARAQATLRRAARWGVSPMEVESQERILRAVASLTAKPGSQDTEGLLGDLLFEVARLGSGLGVDAESALRRAIQRFEKRLQSAAGTGPCQVSFDI